MAELTAFISHLLETGEARLRGEPKPSGAEVPGLLARLGRAHAEDVLDLAGPPIPFAPQAALAGAQFLAWSCWFLLHRGRPPEEVEALLTMPSPATPSDHLSADLCLRFAGTVYRRAGAVSVQDVLTRRLEETLRDWPLSGALTNITAPPDRPVDFANHGGLLLLYAERLALRPRPSWLVGAVVPYAELVFARRGVPFLAVPNLPTPGEGA